MQTVLEQNPLKERQLHLELKKDEFQAILQFWKVCTGATKVESLTPETRDALEARGLLNPEWINKYKLDLKAIQPNIESAALILNNVLPTLDQSLLRTRELIRTQRYNEALENQIKLQDTLILPLERELRIVMRCINARTNSETSLESKVIDLVCNHIFQPVIDNCLQRQISLGGRRSMAPLALLLQSNEALGAQRFQRYPFELVPVNQEELNTPWTLIKLFQPISNKLYLTLGIDSDILGLVNHLTRVHNLNYLTAQLLGMGRVGLATELIGTMLAGPAYLSATIEASTAPTSHVVDPRLNPFKVPLLLQWHAGCSVLEMIGMSHESRTLREKLFATYGTPDMLAKCVRDSFCVAEMFQFIPSIAHSILTTPLSSLGGGTLLNSLPVYTMNMHQSAIATKNFLSHGEVTGVTPGKKDKEVSSESHLEFKDIPTLVALLSGCRMAFEELSAERTHIPSFAGTHKAFLTKAVNSIIQALPPIESTPLNSIEDISIKFHWNQQMINGRATPSAAAFSH
jgi:hypothetical protein